MKSKKGISAIIAYVLLLGMAVALGVFVSMWYLQASEKQSTQILGSIEGGALCDEVNANFGFDYVNCKFNIKNSGKYTIQKIDFNILDATGNPIAYTYDGTIAPNKDDQTDKITQLDNENGISFTATVYVKSGEQLLSCAKDREYKSDSTTSFTSCNS